MSKAFCLMLALLCAGASFSQTIVATGPLCGPGGSTTLNVQNPPAGATYQWKLNGTAITGATNASYPATEPGTYVVDIKVGEVTTPTPDFVLARGAVPAADFSFTNNLCANTAVAFTNSSTGSGLRYAWNFDDAPSGANTSTAANPNHTFVRNAVGNGTESFGVQLTVTNADGCSAAITKTVTVKQIPSTALAGSGGPSVYDSKSFFRQCTGVNSFNFNFANGSTTNNAGYRIVWGDNSADFAGATFTTQSHVYPLGTTPLKFEVTGQNGCVANADYFVFVGSNPAVGLGNPGNTTICTGSSLTFPISNTSSNPPGTIYRVTFNDGTADRTFSHPAPAEITHTFNRASCTTTSGSNPAYPASFSASIVASNPCQSSSATVVPIYVSERPQPAISTPSDSVCTNQNVSFTNSGLAGNFINNGNCEPSRSLWSVSPATGWTVVSGTLGNDNGSTDPSLWLSGAATLGLRFTAPGTYTIKLRNGNPLCGIAEVTKTICVNALPTASFTVDNNTGCGPLVANTTNTSGSPTCGTYRYQWSVSYANPQGCGTGGSNFSFINGTSAGSVSPQFRFVNPGVYTIALVVINPGGLCSSVAATQTITVKDKPRVNIGTIAAICQNGSINPTATVNSCYGTQPITYSWTFAGGSPASAGTASAGPITYGGVGTQQVRLEVSNECGNEVATQNFSITAAPTVNNPGNRTVCAGTQSAAIGFTGTGSGYSWTNSNPAIGLPATGSGTLPAFTAINNGTTAQVATITVSPQGGCPGISASFTLTVNPRPQAPVVISPVTYCQGATATQLTATAASGNTLTWYNNAALTGGSGTAPTPSTTTDGSFPFYVTQSDGTCVSPAAFISVQVQAGITGNTINPVPAVCAGNAAARLQAPQLPAGGTGTYTYQWQSSADGGSTWNDITGANAAFYDPGVLAANTQFRRLVSSGVCTGNVSNTVAVTVAPALSGSGISNGSQVICAGQTPAVLDGQTAAGGGGTISYQWQESANGSTGWTNIAGQTSEDYAPPALTATRYYQRITNAGVCTAASAVIQVTVNPVPVMTAIPDQVWCNNSSVPGLVFTATPAGTISYSWTNDNTAIGLAASGAGSLPAFTATNSNSAVVPEAGRVTVTPTRTVNGVSCTGAPVGFSIAVLPVVSVQAISDITLCSGITQQAFTPVHNAGNFPGSSVRYQWTVSGSGINLNNGSGTAIPSFTAQNNGSSDQVATITVQPVYQLNGVSCPETAVSYRVTVKPGTPVANAGPDRVLCAAGSYTMQAQALTFGSGQWQQVSGPLATIADPASPATAINGLQPGNVYVFGWTVSGAAGCAPTSDEITLDIKPALVNAVPVAPQVVCIGSAVTITAQPATGGGTTPSYSWLFSTDGSSWRALSGQTGASLLNYLPAQSGYLRRLVQAAPCTDSGQIVTLTVQAAVANNTISGTQAICVGTTAVLLQGTLPTGADGNFLYQWEQSIDGGASWQVIGSAVNEQFQPVGPTQTTRYRRVVTTSLCAGPQRSVSNEVIVTVNPDALAAVRVNRDTDCAPFAITSSVLANLADPARNSSYRWYINGSLAGNGVNFPGTVLTRGNDSVLVKLVAVSRFGCKSDSVERRFYTFDVPEPSFTISTTGGCGPLNVQFNNTTPNAGRYRFFWNFGNGRTSTQPQPGSVSFATNPSFGDTAYTVTLHAISDCDTIRVSRQVQVGSPPKALFTPSKTVGCSPMQVTFRNTSLGLGSSYSWNFGDGTIANRATADTISHTFITGVRDTFRVKLRAVNTCGEDSATFAIVVAPSNIRLDFAVNGNEQSGCAPHGVRLINNSRGASAFRWQFGDGNILSTTRNVDTITHLFQRPGTYVVNLSATNGCTDTSSTETITVYPRPRAAFSAGSYNICIGDTVRFANSSDSANTYFWQFGDGGTATLVHPLYQYRQPGTYTASLVAVRTNPTGSVCTDTVTRIVNVTSTTPGRFDASDTLASCAPLRVQFANRNLPAATAIWDFGDGNIATGDVVTHTFTRSGDYRVRLSARSPQGCLYQSERLVRLQGPSGTLSYTPGVVCNDNAVRFQVQAVNTDTIIWNFGDGTVLKTTTNVVLHRYANGGTYLPVVSLVSRSGCVFRVPGADSIRVDKIKADFSSSPQAVCGRTAVAFRDASSAFFGNAVSSWRFGDGATGAGTAPVHDYATTGSYPVQLIVTGNSGCSDTLLRRLPVKVNDIPAVSILAPQLVCTRYAGTFNAGVQSIDAVGTLNWRLSTGAAGTGNSFSHTFSQPGTFQLQLIGGTVNGCYDTTYHTVRVDTAPRIRVNPGRQICAGQSLGLQAAGAPRISWSPVEGLSCTTCFAPLATPGATTVYQATGTSNEGCTDTASVLVTVIPRMNLRVSANDSICTGTATQLMASGAASYSWSPAATLSSSTAANPLARPNSTTTYQVIGYDGRNCFSDTGYVTVAVGQYPTVSLGPDLTLATGTQHLLAPVVQNGPIRRWTWSPATDLDCATCPQPVAYVRKEITYTVTGTTPYGCSASDTINIKVFCANSQVFIPNAFSPDGDGVNDILMVRASGITLVKTFRVFNRWGEVVFERSHFRPNDPAFGWDGRVRGSVGQPEVYVYTAEVICDNGAGYTYKGNVSILK